MASLVAFGGRMASGKTTAASFLAAVAGYRVVSLATPIKELAAAEYEDENELWAHVYAWADFYNLRSYLPGTDFNSFLEETVAAIKQYGGRRRLQVLGTDIGRRYRRTLWVDMLIRSVQLRPVVSFAVDDVRFTNEVQMLRENGFHTIFLDISDATQRERLLNRDGAIDPEALQHVSEKEIMEAREFFHEAWPEETPAARYTRLVNRFVSEYAKEQAYLHGLLVGVEPI